MSTMLPEGRLGAWRRPAPGVATRLDSLSFLAPYFEQPSCRVRLWRKPGGQLRNTMSGSTDPVTQATSRGAPTGEGHLLKLFDGSSCLGV